MIALGLGVLLGLAIGLVCCSIVASNKDRSWSIALEAVNRSWQREEVAPRPTDYKTDGHLRLVK